MNIWLTEVGESLPIGDNRGCRLRRIGMLAQVLADAGHEVTWWASSFDHYRKCHVTTGDETMRVHPHITIRTLRGVGYKRNLSLRRLLDYRLVGLKFARQAPTVTTPDVILSGFPSIELSAACVAYGRRLGIPVVLDVKDMWPDIFLEYAPACLRVPFRLALWPMFGQARRTCHLATAITGMTDAFVDWGVAQAQRARTGRDQSFPFGYASAPPPAEAIEMAKRDWDAMGVTEAAAGRTVCYMGAIGHHLDLETVMRSARKLHAQRSDIQFVLCGSGDRLNEYRQQTADLTNILWAGWVDAARMHVLMHRSMAGLDPLPDRFDFLASINNKAIEYLSAGLPVVSSPKRGVLHKLLLTSHTGVSYECGDHDELCRILSDLHDRPEWQGAMAKAARRVFEERFTAEKVYAEMAAYLVDIGSAAKP